MLILATKLKNAINRAAPADWNYALEYKLKNIVVNGNKFGCSGFIRNPKNDAIVYVSTEEHHYLVRSQLVRCMVKYLTACSHLKGDADFGV